VANSGVILAGVNRNLNSPSRQIPPLWRFAFEQFGANR